MDRTAVLRRVMQVLSVKGFAKTSIVDLTNTAGVDYRTLHKTFGTRKDILRAAIRFCVETEASLAQEPLRVSPTGREAILAMLEENVRLRRHWPGGLWLPVHVQRPYRPSRRARPPGLRL